ncbi:protein transport protein SEC61 subunit gamma and related proteins, partial [Mytilus galloprovincialis]
QGMDTCSMTGRKFDRKERRRRLIPQNLRLKVSCTNILSFGQKKKFQKIAMATAIGFAIMGFIGFFVKLIHIPINNIIVGS